jgi:hypothetical protein
MFPEINLDHIVNVIFISMFLFKKIFIFQLILLSFLLRKQYKILSNG